MRGDLAKMRLSKNMTIRDLSKISGVGKTTISAIENSRTIPRLDTIVMLARALGMATGTLADQLAAGEKF